MSDIPEAILSKAQSIYEGSWPDPVRAIAEALMEASMPDTYDLPADIIERLLAIGPVEWGQTHTKTDGKHIDDLEDTLRLTREYFGIEDKETAMHGIYLAGSGVVLAHTGMSPNSPQHARILAGAWNQLVDLARSQSPTLVANSTDDDEGGAA